MQEARDVNLGRTTDLAILMKLAKPTKAKTSKAETSKPVRRPGRGRVFDSITEAIGDTPLVRLQLLPGLHKVKATILVKLEYLNPAASVKDRIGVAMVEAMERAGAIGPETVLI